MATFVANLNSTARISARWWTGSGFVRNPALDFTFDPYANYYAGVPKAVGTLSVVLISQSTKYTINATASISATFIPATLISSLLTKLTGYGGIGSRAISSEGIQVVPPVIFYNSPSNSNWVAWSKIGDVRVHLDLTNDAGCRPMPFDGYIYAIKKLGKSAVVYGSEGIAEMYPVEDPAPAFGLNVLHRLGILTKDSISGTEFIHYFIDSSGNLCKLANPKVTAQINKDIDKLGYSEYLLPLAASSAKVVLNYDALNERLYISNGTTGYIYTDSGLGGGFARLTTVQAKGTLLLSASSAPEILGGFEICTDVVDFGVRGIKTLFSIEVGTDSSVALYASVDYRMSKADSWSQTSWRLINKEGVVVIPTAGIEFRVRIKSIVYADLEIDYLHFKYKTTDKRFSRGKPMNFGEGGNNDY